MNIKYIYIVLYIHTAVLASSNTQKAFAKAKIRVFMCVCVRGKVLLPKTAGTSEAQDTGDARSKGATHQGGLRVEAS